MSHDSGQDGVCPEGDAATGGPWGPALEQLRSWNPAWADTCARMSTKPWRSGVLSTKLVELISVLLNAQCTNLDPEGTRRHIRAALDAGASRDEILFVLECAALGAIHSCSLGAPILLEEARAAGVATPGKPARDAHGGRGAVAAAGRNATAPSAVSTPTCDRLRAIGQWNPAWDDFYALDPAWTEEFIATGIPVYTSGVLPPKEVELLCIAFDASFTHLYAPGTRRHVRAALAAGATVEEILEVLEICVVRGVQSCNLGVPILAEELARRERAPTDASTTGRPVERAP